jgi:Mn-dependent DtxR family transcriptional regulator
MSGSDIRAARLSQVRPMALRHLSVLVSFSDSYCPQTAQQLADAMGVSEATAEKWAVELEALGLLTCETTGAYQLMDADSARDGT